MITVVNPNQRLCLSEPVLSLGQVTWLRLYPQEDITELIIVSFPIEELLEHKDSPHTRQVQVVLLLQFKR